MMSLALAGARPRAAAPLALVVAGALALAGCGNLGPIGAAIDTELTTLAAQAKAAYAQLQTFSASDGPQLCALANSLDSGFQAAAKDFPTLITAADVADEGDLMRAVVIECSSTSVNFATLLAKATALFSLIQSKLAATQ